MSNPKGIQPPTRPFSPSPPSRSPAHLSHLERLLWTYATLSFLLSLPLAASHLFPPALDSITHFVEGALCLVLLKTFAIGVERVACDPDLEDGRVRMSVGKAWLVQGVSLVAAMGLSNLPGFVLRKERIEVRLVAWGATTCIGLAVVLRATRAARQMELAYAASCEALSAREQGEKAFLEVIFVKELE